MLQKTYTQKIYTQNAYTQKTYTQKAYTQKTYTQKTYTYTITFVSYHTTDNPCLICLGYQQRIRLDNHPPAKTRFKPWPTGKVSQLYLYLYVTLSHSHSHSQFLEAQLLSNYIDVTDSLRSSLTHWTFSCFDCFSVISGFDLDVFSRFCHILCDKEALSDGCRSENSSIGGVFWISRDFR